MNQPTACRGKIVMCEEKKSTPVPFVTLVILFAATLVIGLFVTAKSEIDILNDTPCNLGVEAHAVKERLFEFIYISNKPNHVNQSGSSINIFYIEGHDADIAIKIFDRDRPDKALTMTVSTTSIDSNWPMHITVLPTEPTFIGCNDSSNFER